MSIRILKHAFYKNLGIMNYKLSGLLLCFLAAPLAGVAADSNQRHVIIHSDDAGMSHSVNRATIDAMERGIVSSASIMVPCPWFPEIAKYAAAHPEKDFGIHLTLNAEWDLYRWGPVADRSRVSSLVDEDGYLWDNVAQVGENAKVEHVEIELRAQIERAKKFGVPISHLDTHMGAVLARPDIAQVYFKLGVEYNLPVLIIRPTPENGIEARFSDAANIVSLLESKGLPILDTLYQYYDRKPLEDRKAKYLQTLRELPVGVSQIIIHCGYDDLELRNITSSVQTRDGDRRIFMDDDVKAEIEKHQIKVINWREFRELGN